MLMMPQANRSDGTELLITRYIRFYKKFIEGNTDDVKKYRRRIFGEAADLIADSPEVLNELLLVLEVMPYNDWKDLPIRDRAKILAALKIKNMRSTLERHLEVQKAERERREARKSEPRRS